MPVDGRGAMLLGLTQALVGLADRMRRQQANAKQITVLAAKAERIAERAVALHRLRGDELGTSIDRLVEDVKALAREAAEASAAAGQEVLLGKQVADAIAAHSDALAVLAADPARFADMRAVREQLRPLVTTLAKLPERLTADRALSKTVGSIAELAGGLADRADALSDGGVRFSTVAIELGRELRHFANHAAAFSLDMAQDAALAVTAIDTMAGRTGELAAAGPVPNREPTAHDRLMWLATHAHGTLDTASVPQTTAVPWPLTQRSRTQR